MTEPRKKESSTSVISLFFFTVCAPKKKKHDNYLLLAKRDFAFSLTLEDVSSYLISLNWNTFLAELYIIQSDDNLQVAPSKSSSR